MPGQTVEPSRQRAARLIPTTCLSKLGEATLAYVFFRTLETVHRLNWFVYQVVYLTRSHRDGKLYVMKQIDLNDISKQEREGALQEVLVYN